MKFLNYLKIIKFNGGEGGIQPTNKLPVADFQDSAFNRSATSPLKFALFNTIKVNK